MKHHPVSSATVARVCIDDERAVTSDERGWGYAAIWEMGLSMSLYGSLLPSTGTCVESKICSLCT